MWKHRIWYLAVVIAALISYLAADRQEPLVLLCILVVTPFLSAALQWTAMRGIQVVTDVPGTCRMGQEISVGFGLRRKSRMPLGTVRMQVVFENVLYGDKSTAEVWLQPSEQEDMRFVYLFKAVDCGNVKIHVPVIECRDLLGLFRFRRPAGISEEILIYPPEIQINSELLQKPESKSFGEMYDQDRKGQDVSEISGLREYVPGDSMNSIHWKLSGKLDQLIVREFGKPSHYNTLILYEMMKKSGETKIPNSYNNAVLALTVSLSLSMLKLNLEHNVGRVLHRDFQVVPVYSIDTCEQMQLNLLCMPIAGEENGADTVYSFLRGNLRNDYTKIIYITPCYEENTARQLSREVDLTVIQIVQGKGMNYTASAGYAVISVDVDIYQDTMNNITI